MRRGKSVQGKVEQKPILNAELSIELMYILTQSDKSIMVVGRGSEDKKKVLKTLLRFRDSRVEYVSLPEISRATNIMSLIYLSKRVDMPLYTTHYAESFQEALQHLRSLFVKMTFKKNESEINNEVNSLLDFIIQVDRLPNGQMYISEISQLAKSVNGFRKQRLLYFDAYSMRYIADEKITSEAGEIIERNLKGYDKIMQIYLDNWR